MKPGKQTQRGPNQGEGDRVSARHYNKKARKFAASGNVAPAARDAERFVEQSPEAASRAEDAAKRGPHPADSTVDGLIAKGRSVVERVRPIVDRTVGKLRNRFSRKSKNS